MWRFDSLPVPHLRTPLPGPKASELLARDDLYVSPSYTRVYPLVVETGSGAVVEDVDGNRFLDFTAGIAVTSTGHCHPEVVRAIQEQAGRLIHMSGTDFYYRPSIDLAERLAKVAPGNTPKRVFFTNSGAEAVEAAMKLARWHTHRSRLVAFYGGFHGRTYGAMSLSGSKLVHRRGFSPLVPDIHHLPYPTADGDFADAENTLFRRTCPPEEVAAIFVEAIQGEGGYRLAPPGFLQRLRDFCDRHGILLVVDEIQSGMGRTGKMFAVEHWGVEPDIICTAKGIASGLPLGAIIAKDVVMDWPSGSHANTFGGNPVACRAALVTIDLLEREYMMNAQVRGAELRAGLNELSGEFPHLHQVRGLGLMVAVDVVKRDERNGILPDPTLRDQIVQTAFEHGLLLLGCGETAIRFCPPLCVTSEQVGVCLRVLREVLGEIEAGVTRDDALVAPQG